MFRGPVFVVGRPRSGTKLLRALLNGHSAISIPFWESNFIPKSVAKAKEFGDLSDPKNFVLFFDFFSKIEFFRKIRENPFYSDIVDNAKWFHAIEDFFYADIIKAFYTMYADRDNKCIWGDKSPHYMIDIPTLKQLFPECRFIHIVRDVRDHCLSNMKVWNKNPYRAAQMWVDAIRKCRKDASFCLGGSYYELKYESLLDDPEQELRKVCDFLSIQYEETMLTLGKPVERYGDAKNARGIVRNNKDKWRTKMPRRMIEKIETIGYDMLRELDYEVVYARNGTNFTSFEMQIARVADSWNRFKFDCTSQGGLAKAIIYQYKKRMFG